jgi:integrase
VGKRKRRQKRVQKYARQIGITAPVTFQVLRRSFATRHRNELKDAGAVMGHSSFETPTANVYAQSVEASVIAMLEENERQIGLMEPFQAARSEWWPRRESNTRP